MDMHIAEIPNWVTWTLALAAAAAGFWRGGNDGRVVAVLVLGQLWLGWVVRPLLSIETGHLIGAFVDAATLAACLVLVLRGRNYWTVWAAASATLSIATLGLRSVADLSIWAYFSAQLTWYYVLAGSLLVGSLTRRRPAPGSNPSAVGSGR